ncbi:hypothetical protein Tco_0260115 [Tanacetum coccineum]
MASNDSTFYGERADNKKVRTYLIILLLERYPIIFEMGNHAREVTMERSYTRTALDKVAVTKNASLLFGITVMPWRHHIDVGMLADLRDRIKHKPLVESLKRDKHAPLEKLLQEITNKKTLTCNQKEHKYECIDCNHTKAKARADAKSNDEKPEWTL